MDVIYAILPFVGILVGLVVFHELGHYITAKMFGIKVLEAGIGYPPRLWGFNWRGTLYSINWLPLGGFVRLLGEEDPSDPQSLAAQAAWKRLVVLIAGSFMNFIAPIILFAIAFSIPRDVPVGPAVITFVETGAPAAEAGLQSGDKILAIDGDKVKNTLEATREIRLRLGQTIDFKVERDLSDGGSEVLTIPVKSRWAPPSDQGPTGIKVDNQYGQFTESESFPPWEAIPKGWEATWDSLTLARNQVIAMFHGGSGPEVAGPVGLADATGEVVEQAGWEPLLELAAILSINLAVINLLPLPMLDGGRVAFVLIEIARRGKRIAPEKEALVHLVGLALILTMAVVVTYFDVARLVSGKSLFD